MNRQRSTFEDSRDHRRRMVSKMRLTCPAVVQVTRPCYRIAALLVMMACNGDARSPKILDTLVVNSRRPVLLPTSSPNRWTWPLKSDVWEFVSGDQSLLSNPTYVHCVRVGDMILRLASGNYNRSLVVRCRPVQGFRHMPVLEFLVGDAGQSYSVEPIGIDGQYEQLLAGRAAVRDTAVAKIVDGDVHPVSPGRTALVFQFGDCDIHIPIEVQSRAASPRDVTSASQYVEEFGLRGDEAKVWPLRQGRFTITLRTFEADTSFKMSVTDAKCFPLRREFQSLSCVTTSTSNIAVIRIEAGRSDSLLQSELRIVQSREANIRPSAIEVERRRRQAELCPWIPLEGS